MALLQTTLTPDRTATLAHKPLLFFSGFSYLGLHALPAYKEALKAGVDLYGTVFVSSRIANLRLGIYEELEHALAVLLRQQAAVTFSSGYLAAQAAVQYLANWGQLLYAPGAHPSLWLGRPALPAQDWQEWAAETLQRVNAHADHSFVVVAEAVNPLTGMMNDFGWLAGVKRKLRVLIDDSHGIGILGPEGNGSVHTLPLQPQLHYLFTASLAKAYSTQGGVVAGYAADIAAIRKTALFTAGSPMMPAGAHAFLQSFALHATQRQLLQQRIARFTELCANIGGLHNPHRLPVFRLNGKPGIEKYLLDHDIVISSFGYPDPDSPPVNRIVLSALHTPHDLEVLHRILATAETTR